MFWDRFVTLCNQSGVTPTSVVSTVGISAGSVTAWKRGSQPRPDKVKAIADFFHVSPEYLLGQTDDRTPAEDGGAETADATPAGLTEQEQTLVRLFRETTEEGRVEMIAAIWNIYKERKNAVESDDERAIG